MRNHNSNRHRNHVAEMMAKLIVMLIKYDRLAVKQLAGELGVSVRTVIRYLNALEMAGFAIPPRVRKYGLTYERR